MSQKIPFIVKINSRRNAEVFHAINKQSLHTHSSFGSGYIAESAFPCGDDEITINFTNGKSARVKAFTGQMCAWY